jgi:putative hydrolase of the HAD superfamily
MTMKTRVWLFDLDDTLHDATEASMGEIRDAMGAYMVQHLGLSEAEASARRQLYWRRYGATLLGVVRHDGVKAEHFLHHTHVLPGLEARVRGHAADIAALARLPGRRYIVTNAPLAYALRVLGALGIRHLFDGVIAIEAMRMFGQLRPKPDARMLRMLVAKLQVHPSQCTLVEDTLVHQKAARRVGMATVWMQRWLAAHDGAARSVRSRRRPAYVDRRVRTLRALMR